MPTWLPYSQPVHGAPLPATQPEVVRRFIARQPILDRMQRTYGYELLFRSGWENRFAGDGEAASRYMIDNAITYGIESMAGDAVPFINCTRSLLVDRMPTMLPRHTVLEVLETIEPDAEVTQACKELHALGYALALDDFDCSDRWDPLLPFVDYIKLDFRATTRAQRGMLMHRLKFHSIRFVAEKVETREELDEAMQEGFHLFQGYYFYRPQVLARTSISAMVGRLRFLAELSQSNLDRDRMLRLVKEEPSVSYRVLRLANSAAVSARDPVKDLRSALSMIGDEQFRKVATLALATEIAGQRSLEPIRFILQRARFFELVASNTGLQPGEMYMFGLVSVVRTALQVPDRDLAASLRLPPDVMAALNGEQNVYAALLSVAEGMERAEWTRIARDAVTVRIAEHDVPALWLQAQRWAGEVLALA